MAVKCLVEDLASDGDFGRNGLALKEAHGGLAAAFAHGIARGIVDFQFGFDFHDGRGAEVGGVDAVAAGDAVVVNRATVLIHFNKGTGKGGTGDNGTGNWICSALVDRFDLQIAVGIFVATAKK